MIGPLGPFVSFKDRLSDQSKWKLSLSESDLPGLRLILVMPDAELVEQGMDPDEICDLVLGGITEVAKNIALAPVLTILEELLALPERRCQTLDAIGAIGNRRAFPLLEKVFESLPAWGEEVAVSLASALGMLGGVEAMALLERLKMRYPANSEVQEEIRIAQMK